MVPVAAIAVTVGTVTSSMVPVIWLISSDVPAAWLASVLVEPSLKRMRSGRAIVAEPGCSAATSVQPSNGGSVRRVPSASDWPTIADASTQKPASASFEQPR